MPVGSQVAGTCTVNGTVLSKGDGAELSNETVVPVDNPHVILFEPIDLIQKFCYTSKNVELYSRRSCPDITA